MKAVRKLMAGQRHYRRKEEKDFDELVEIFEEMVEDGFLTGVTRWQSPSEAHVDSFVVEGLTEFGEDRMKEML